MSSDNARVGDAEGYCLADTDRTHFIFFFEDADAVTVNLNGMPISQPAIALDAKAAYQEIDKGDLKAGVHVIGLGHTSDWVLAIGDFSVR